MRLHGPMLYSGAISLGRVKWSTKEVSIYRSNLLESMMAIGHIKVLGKYPLITPIYLISFSPPPPIFKIWNGSIEALNFLVIT